MRHALSAILLAGMAWAFAPASVNDADAMGVIPKKPGDYRTVPTPAPLAGGGILGLGVVAGAGVYLMLRRRKRP
jgi:hypothetical protein